MNRMWRDADVDRTILDSKTVAVIGYGIQGRAQAHNLRDSGVDVIIGGRPTGSGIPAARTDGFPAFPTAEAAARADVIFLLTPDETHAEILARDINPAIKSGAALGFACGYSVTFSAPPLPENVDVIMVAPKGPGRALRSRFTHNSGLPALVAVHSDATGKALEIALAYAASIGCARLALVESTFAEEAETDLFGEQAVLCGGIPKLMEAGFTTLVDAGYSPEAAYIECVWEAKAIVDLIFERGIAEMYDHISPTARYGGLTRGPRVVTPDMAESMKSILANIRSGKFADELAAAESLSAAARGTLLAETSKRLRDTFKP